MTREGEKKKHTKGYHGIELSVTIDPIREFTLGLKSKKRKRMNKRNKGVWTERVHMNCSPRKERPQPLICLSGLPSHFDANRICPPSPTPFFLLSVLLIPFHPPGPVVVPQVLRVTMVLCSSLSFTFALHCDEPTLSPGTLGFNGGVWPATAWHIGAVPGKGVPWRAT